MNGIFNILKPSGMTSFDVIRFLKKQIKISKIGHAGTLDPDACGVLPICVGGATKAVEYMMESNKKYRAELTLGIKTDTQDAEGHILQENPMELSENDIILAINSFVGEYNQIPPMYSSVKVNGKKLYELARQGNEVYRKARKVMIYSIKIISIDLSSKYQKIIFDVDCSKGTYIRTLCNDIGEKLGCGGFMSFLVRTKAGFFKIEDSITLDQIKESVEEGNPTKHISPVDSIFENTDSIIINDRSLFKILNGGYINVQDYNFSVGQNLLIYTRNHEFIGLGEIIKENNMLFIKSKKRFI